SRRTRSGAASTRPPGSSTWTASASARNAASPAATRAIRSRSTTRSPSCRWRSRSRPKPGAASPPDDPIEAGNDSMTNYPAWLPTTVGGSDVQPDGVIARQNFHSLAPPRVRAREIWRIPEEFLEEVQVAAPLAAFHDMEHAGIDIVTDCEFRRESCSNRLVAAL